MFARKLLCLSLCNIRNALLSTSHGTLFKHFSVAKGSSESMFCEPLKQRRLLKICGPDATEYLQGMTTNDVKNITESEKNVSSSLRPMYSMLLNSHGRVLYDVLLCKISDEEYLLEYDTTAQPYIIKHLEMYKLRKDVTMKGIDNLQSWVAFSSKADSDTNEETSSCPLEIISCLENKEGVAAVFKDPRVPQLGCRFIVESNTVVKNLGAEVPLNIVHEPTYDILRYKLGVGEGVMDHPPGNCLPLECNVDYLHGVNFQKGCYIGQELTARIYHTGVVRKRLMPVTFISSQEIKDFPAGCTVVNEKGMKMGKLRSNVGLHGLALLNVKESLKSEVLTLRGYDVKIKTKRPCWWPQDDKKTSAQ